MEDFGAQLAGFALYFTSVAQISGALLGLVFVALTFNPKTPALRHDLAMRSLAQQVFADFLMVMVLSLILLIPHLSTSEVSLVLVLLAIVGIARLIRNIYALRHGTRASRWMLLQRFWLSLLGNAGFLATGLLLHSGGSNLSAATSALLSSPLILLIGGSRSAWLLVMQSAE